MPPIATAVVAVADYWPAARPETGSAHFIVRDHLENLCFVGGLGGGGQAGGVWPPPVLMSAVGARDVGADPFAGPEAADRGAGFAVVLGAGHLGFLSGAGGGGGDGAARDQGDTGSSGSGIGGRRFLPVVLVAGARKNSHTPCPIHYE